MARQLDFWVSFGCSIVLLISGIIFGRSAHAKADEITSLVTTHEYGLIFGFAYNAVCASFFLSVSVSFLLASVFFWRLAKHDSMKRREKRGN
jgi:hypothetical protein